MKKLLILLVGIIGLSQVAQAREYGVAGCGLGSLIFKKDSQILASITNAVVGDQTFGITSGTSNCTDERRSARLNLFIEANRYALQNDVARGDGEIIASLAEILGCQNTTDYKSTLKTNFKGIFPSNVAQPEEVSGSIKKALKENKATAGQCAYLG